MFIQQLYTTCLSEAAYFIESNGEAAVIDPIRDIAAYLTLAKEKDAVIKYIFETHFHADFISGHLELAAATGATIVYGPRSQTAFAIHQATDGETFKLGNITLTALHTPGHTIESTCYLLQDETGKQHAVFTGDTLLIGDVGRTDIGSGNLSSEVLAGMLYDSLQEKMMPLANDILVYPAHGAGSSCGKNIGTPSQSTIGEQKRLNSALQPQTKDDFILAVTEGLADAPKYFAINAQLNKEGYPALADLIKKGMNPLKVLDFKKRISTDEVIILDTRPSAEFTQAFIPGSIFIGLEGKFSEWAGSLLPFNTPILLITSAGQEEETIIHLASVGFDSVEGYLEGGFASWQAAGEAIDLIVDVEADELAMDIPHDSKLIVVDVRKEMEYGDGHVKNAINLPLIDLTDTGTMAVLEDDMNAYVHCGGGYRSVIAISLLKRQGIHNVRNVLGGWNQIKEQSSIEIQQEDPILD